jgi:hypothetical protein
MILLLNYIGETIDFRIRALEAPAPGVINFVCVYGRCSCVASLEEHYLPPFLPCLDAIGPKALQRQNRKDTLENVRLKLAWRD